MGDAPGRAGVDGEPGRGAGRVGATCEGTDSVCSASGVETPAVTATAPSTSEAAQRKVIPVEFYERDEVRGTTGAQDERGSASLVASVG